MDDFFPSWLLPAWSIGAPVLMVVPDHLRTPGAARNKRDRPMPRQTSALRRA